MEQKNTLQIQAVLYKNTKESLERSLISLANAASYAQKQSRVGKVVLSWGDASPAPLYTEAEIETLRERIGKAFPTLSYELRYFYFNENTGYGRGHNRLSGDANSEYLLILNPDIVVCQDFFSTMLAPFAEESVGLTEARQTPVEHQKYYDKTSGETYWSSGACFVIPTALFRELRGFDDESFFMYCEDVDLSFRIRNMGKRLIYVPKAPVYHSRGFDGESGRMIHTRTELRYSVEAQMVLAYKWGFRSMLRMLMSVCKNGDELQREAYESFCQRRDSGELRRVEGRHAKLRRQFEKSRFAM